MRASCAAALLVITASACSKHSETPQTSAAVAVPAATPAASPEGAFWAWFVANKDALGKTKRADEPIANDLANQLAKVDPGLTFELGGTPVQHELVVSADGIKNVFPAVQRVVASAPAIPGWKVTAFRPRGSTNSAIEMGDGRKLSGGQLSFRVLATQAGTIDVALYVPGEAATTDPVKQCVYLLLDSALGEYDVETRIGKIEIEPGAEAPRDARPFSELPGVVDVLK